ncbi:unnamed protein product [Rotaria sordida]|uniref:Uncharacterized protein n=1 Tax=Rotaria sordida TaxID=392033 RepID=A0A820FT50_9BILA|nr:unnamed protein product [Rotaria sordida]
MLHVCRQYYKDNQTTLKKIDIFDESYASDSAAECTTTAEDVARLFIEDNSNDLIAILWEIKINTKHTRTIFADISSFSAVKDESEILFTIGSLFKIESIDKNFNQSLCKITLTTVDDEDTCDSCIHEELIIIQETLRGQLPMLQLSSILLCMGEFDSFHFEKFLLP